MQELLPLDLQAVGQIVALAVGHLHQAGEHGPELHHDLRRRQADADDALGRALPEEVLQELVGGVVLLDDLLDGLVQLGPVQIDDAVAPHDLVGGGVLAVKADDGGADRVVGVEPVGIGVDRGLDLLLQELHIAQQDRVHDLFLALEIDVQGGFAVFRLPGDVVHGRLFNPPLRKQLLRRRQDRASVEFGQCLFLTQRIHTSGLFFRL